MDNLFFEKFDKPFILVIGVGEGGCNALQHVYKQNKSKALDFCAIDTDVHALNSIDIPSERKLLIGEERLNGFGAASKPVQGELAAMENVSKINEFLEGDYTIAFVLTGMGGGTGTGASPVIARLCWELDIFTIGVLSTPFTTEGSKRKNVAMEGVNKIKAYTDSVFLFSNDYIFNKYPEIKISESFSYSDAIFKQPIDFITRIMTQFGYIDIDFSDVKSVLADSCFSTVDYGEAEGENRIDSALEQILQSPFISNVNLSEVKNILINLEAGEVEVEIAEINEVLDFMKKSMGEDIDIIWGVGYDESLGSKLRLTVMLSSLKEVLVEEVANPEGPEKKIVLQRQEYHGKTTSFVIIQFGNDKNWGVEILSD
ncbi:hypothetical protein EYV94_10505 [Puteibacter caeruleilacunae]|nr:hypothetical protein EYV94_10505 [Puteibacter caeruleilacunae]